MEKDDEKGAEPDNITNEKKVWFEIIEESDYDENDVNAKTQEVSINEWTKNSHLTKRCNGALPRNSLNNPIH